MKVRRALSILTLLILLSSSYVWGAQSDELGYPEPIWTIKTTAGEILLITSIEVHVGDQFLNEDNTLYTVHSVDGQGATAEQTEKIDLFQFLYPNTMTADQDAIPVQARQGKVGIYHTHGWESYRPSDGKTQIVGRGGIFDVGDALAAGFQDKGISVERSTEQERNYNTSRRTAMDLLKNGNELIIDVHRDTAPASQYYHTIDGQPATKILMVVGRQNPNMAVNKELAFQVKGAADQSRPGLIRGVYMAHGNYNQDLSPRAILAEFGSATNLKEAASLSAYAFAGIISEMLFPPVPTAEKMATEPAPVASEKPRIAAERRALWQSYLAWVALILVMSVGFLLINEPNLQAIGQRLKRFSREEFGDLLSRVKRK